MIAPAPSRPVAYTQACTSASAIYRGGQRYAPSPEGAVRATTHVNAARDARTAQTPCYRFGVLEHWRATGNAGDGILVWLAGHL